ncbi:unnamed protein product [marine sediment metagenome]|uniref:Outer membrane protein beta-barrel domain-containing protein n=1 Tax=marine sediment metagenome TaxID=412755 RepID=X0S4J1_9ZZZZ
MRSILNTIVVAFLFAISISSHSFAQSETINQEHKLASDIDFAFIETDYSSSEVIWRLKFKGFRWTATNFVANWFAPDGSLLLSKTFKTKWSNNNEAETKLKLTDEIINTKLGTWKLQVYSGGVLLDEKEFEIKSPADTQVRDKQQEESVDTTETKKTPEIKKVPETKIVRDTANTFYLKGIFGAGAGFDEVSMYTWAQKYDISGAPIGDREEILIRPGGGVNLEGIVGYGITSDVRVEAGIGYNTVGGSPKVKDVKSSFRSFPLRISVIKDFLITTSKFYVGGGISMYLAPELHREAEIEGNKIENTITYSAPVGINVLTGLEMPLGEKYFLFGELRYTGGITYEWEEFTENGIEYDLNKITIYPKWREIDGNNLFFNFGIGIYF